MCFVFNLNTLVGNKLCTFGEHSKEKPTACAAMDQEISGEKQYHNRDSPPVNTSVKVENSESFSSQKNPVTFPFGSAFDISSSSLIKSPLVSELLISHGLLKNGILEDGPLCSEFSSLGESPESPSYSGICSLQSLASWNMLEEEEDEKGDYKCGWDLCDVSFNFRKELAIHVNNSHINQDENSLYRCLWNGCIRHGKAISARYRMLIHMRTHTHEKPHACDVCGKKFSRLENLRIHNRSHTGEKPYVCPVAGCGKAYSNSSDRFKHSKTHQEDKPYVCRVEGCDKRYTDPSSLRKHMKSSAHCGENVSKSNLTAQVNQDFCENINGDQKSPDSLLKSSSSNTLLKSTQSKIFDSKRPYACPVEGCDKRYTDPGSLRKHQRATSHGRDPNSIKMKLSKNKQVLDVTSIIKEHRFSESDALSEEKVNRADLLLGCTLKSTKDIVQQHSPEKEVTKVADVKACHSVVANAADLTPLDLSVCCSAGDTSPVNEEEERNMQGIEDDAIRS